MLSTHLPRIIIALDFPEPTRALQFVETLDPQRCMLKVGKELFTSSGASFVEKLINKGFAIFLDLKFHDIPHQVGNACRAAAELGVRMVDVHALGGRKMMEAAVNALSSYAQRPLLIGVTILTSMQDADLVEIGIHMSAKDMVQRLALLALQSGLDGVVCSAQEATMIKSVCGKEFITVTPGIRLAGELTGATDDQKRIMTPGMAIQAGADFLVVGRPVTGAQDPGQIIAQIEREMSEIL